MQRLKSTYNKLTAEVSGGLLLLQGITDLAEQEYTSTSRLQISEHYFKKFQLPARVNQLPVHLLVRLCSWFQIVIHQVGMLNAFSRLHEDVSKVGFGSFGSRSRADESVQETQIGL
jgi:hypothetical protein